jgi:hypothetical protein
MWTAGERRLEEWQPTRRFQGPAQGACLLGWLQVPEGTPQQEVVTDLHARAALADPIVVVHRDDDRTRLWHQDAPMYMGYQGTVKTASSGLCRDREKVR